MFESEAELRRIRIALVWIAVFLLFGACGNQDTIIETDKYLLTHAACGIKKRTKSWTKIYSDAIWEA